MPQYLEGVVEHERCLSPLFFAEFSRAVVLREQRDALVNGYLEHRTRWLENHARIAELNSTIRTATEEWPLEFPKGTTKPDAAKAVEWVAPDQPMLSNFGKENSRFWDINRFVEDPENEHNIFKKRVVWTEAEKERFVDAYCEHPKQFRLIANELPGKQVKDVIEFYYLNRHRLKLKENEPASRRKGKVRVISEGMVRKESR
jgi:hypothetical protein